MVFEQKRKGLLHAGGRETRAAKRALLREPKRLYSAHAIAMKYMTTRKRASCGFIQWLQTHSALIKLIGLWWRFHDWCSCIRIALENLPVANGHAKPLVSTLRPVLSLAGLTAVINKLAAGTGLEQQVRAVAGADTAVGALSLVARAGGLAGLGGGAGCI